MKTLLIEDDLDLGQSLVDHLEAAGHRTQWCRRLAEAREAPAPDLALLDLGLPDGDGLDLLTEWRAAGHRGCVLVLTARDQVSDRIRGLQAGADDYLVKPFDVNELVARVDAVCRRSHAGSRVFTDTLAIDVDGHCVRRDGQPVSLTAMEWVVFGLLVTNAGRIVTRNRIDRELDTAGLADAESNSLEVIISRLRRKLGSDAIQTNRGLGYSFNRDGGG